MHFIKSVFVILEVLVLFNIIIFVHELGHFLAARWRGLKVDRFAVWFGKPIWKKKIGGVEYALGSIPAGGYVSLPQMAPMDIIEGKSDETATEPLPPISPLDKIIVAFAGPLFSFGLAVLFAVIVWVVGKPGTSTENSTTIGWVDPTGPAYKAGLRPGDKILDIDGHVVTQFAPPSPDSVTWRIISSEGTNIAIKVDREGKENTFYVTPYKRATKWYERRALRQVLIAPVQPAIIFEVASNSPAAVAGFKKGDEVIALNGEKILSINNFAQLEESLTNGVLKPVVFTLKRDGQTIEKTLVAEKPVKPTDFGPSFGIMSFSVRTNEVLDHPHPFDQVRDSAMQIVSTVSVLFSRKSDVGVQQLGGAVMIIRVYSNLLDSDNGWRQVLWFSVVLNVNLALLNLLPLPVLDGGHITLALLELLLRRKVSAKFLNFLQSACAILLIGFMIFIAFFDTSDWVRSANKDRHDEAVEFAPKH